MLKGIMRKIAIATNVLLVMQLAFLGVGSAYASAPITTTNLTVTPSIEGNSLIQGLNTEFEFGVKVQGTVFEDVEENDARIYGVIKDVTVPSNPVAIDSTNLEADGVEVLSSDSEQKALVDSDDLVIAFGNDDGFSLDSKKDDIEGLGYLDSGKLTFAKKGVYSVSYYVYSGPDLDDVEEGFVKIGQSLVSQVITIAETSLDVTGTTPEAIYGATESFDDTVTIKGNLYDDVSNDEAKIYTLISRKDKAAINPADIMIDGDEADELLATSEELADLAITDASVLVIGYPENPEDFSSEKEEIKNGLEIVFEEMNIIKGGIYEISYILFDIDASKIIGKSSKIQTIKIDDTAPKAALVTKAVNSTSPILSGTIDDPEATLWITIDGEDIGGEATINGNTWTIEIADVLEEGLHDVVLDTEDVYGNKATYDEELTIDTKAPSAANNLVIRYSQTSNSVIISWTNPDAATFDHIKIIRKSGSETVTFNPGKVNYFEDGTVLKGKTYSYQIIVVDAAGNETTTMPVYISVPAAKPVTYSYSYYSGSASTSEVVNASEGDTTEVTGEVKADSTTDTTAPIDGEDNESDEKEFPTWGIIALIFLLALGGYLFWVQKPEEEEEPVVTIEKKGGNGNGKNKK